MRVIGKKKEMKNDSHIYKSAEAHDVERGVSMRIDQLRSPKPAIKRRSFFGYGIAAAIGIVLSGELFQKVLKMISSKKAEKKIIVSIHPHAIPRGKSGMDRNG